MLILKVCNMPNIKFVIRNMNAEDEQTIYITARFGRNEKLMYATSLKVEPIFWSEKGAEGQKLKVLHV